MTRTHEEVGGLPEREGQAHTPDSAAIGIEAVLRLLEGRWKVLILFNLFGGRIQRFSDLERHVLGVSQKMLAQQLRQLEADGLVLRTVYAEVPAKVDYRLTDWGQALCPSLDGLLRWLESRGLRGHGPTHTAGDAIHMAPVTVDPRKVHEFADEESFHAWLARHHDKEDEVWIKIHKVSSQLPSITPKQAIDVVLCWGWIDAVRKGLDDKSYLQRYTRRRGKSIWSKINVANVARLIQEGRMTQHGLTEVEAAKADGRWDRAYGSGKEMKIPDDLQAAIEAAPEARKMLSSLSEQNRFAIAFRVHNMKTEAGRRKKIEAFVAMLVRGETIYPQRRK